MILKQWFYTNMFMRNMLADLLGRSESSKDQVTFITYFRYKVGRYQPDHYLYFPKEPYNRQYRNEIFNKLKEYTDSDIPKFLDFHYSAFPDKYAFLRFLRYEEAGRLNRRPKENFRLKLQTVQEWIAEKQYELKVVQEETLKQEIEKEVREVLPAEKPVSQESIENIAESLSEILNARVDQIMSNTEEKMKTLTDSYVTGNIELNNQNHLDGVIKLFKILKDLQAPKTPGKVPEQLFSKFSDTDIAAILRLHFDPLKSKQHSSIQRLDIKKADERIPGKSPKVEQLEKALQVFFYS